MAIQVLVPLPEKDLVKRQGLFQRNKSLTGFVKLPSAVKYGFAM